MEENVVSEKPVFSIGRILKVLSLLCFIFAFCPSFLVSCSGEYIKVSVLSAVIGPTLDGEKVADGHPFMIICLLIPIVIFVLLMIKKLTDRVNVAIVAGCTVLDIVMMFVFKSQTEKEAEEYFCECETTDWYILTLICLFVMLMATIPVLINKLRLDSSPAELFKKGAAGQTVPMADSAATTIGFCTSCGRPIACGSRFCTACGAPVAQSILGAAQAAPQAAEAPAEEPIEEPVQPVAEEAETPAEAPAEGPAVQSAAQPAAEAPTEAPAEESEVQSDAQTVAEAAEATAEET